MIKHIRLQKNAPRHSCAPTFEVEYPYRAAVATILRVFGCHGFMFGQWQDHPDPDDEDLVTRHLFNAVTAGRHAFVLPGLGRDAVEYTDLGPEPELQRTWDGQPTKPLPPSVLDRYMAASEAGPHSAEYLTDLRDVLYREQP